jgi:hypothetical protein
MQKQDLSNACLWTLANGRRVITYPTKMGPLDIVMVVPFYAALDVEPGTENDETTLQEYVDVLDRMQQTFPAETLRQSQTAGTEEVLSELVKFLERRPS